MGPKTGELTKGHQENAEGGEERLWGFSWVQQQGEENILWWLGGLGLHILGSTRTWRQKSLEKWLDCGDAGTPCLCQHAQLELLLFWASVERSYWAWGTRTTMAILHLRLRFKLQDDDLNSVPFLHDQRIHLRLGRKFRLLPRLSAFALTNQYLRYGCQLCWTSKLDAHAEEHLWYEQFQWTLCNW